ncbi:MAG: tetratricopeptide repeat protein [Candidatus Eisenbacteria bacterium]|nr:tetratricopeptide repeat protein [Candidatus Eisenbacteria bacterium]
MAHADDHRLVDRCTRLAALGRRSARRKRLDAALHGRARFLDRLGAGASRADDDLGVGGARGAEQGRAATHRHRLYRLVAARLRPAAAALPLHCTPAGAPLGSEGIREKATIPSKRSPEASPKEFAPMSKERFSGKRVWLFRTIAVLLPVVLLLCVELGFRIAGVARPEPLFLEVRTPSMHKFQTNPRVAERDFPPSLARIMPKPGFQAFDAVKPEGWLRIFCLGASTTAGFPFPAHVSYPALLNEKLRLYLPGRPVEVINCGISAVASFTLVEFTREVLRHAPDLIVVYTGHNEFYGARGAASSAGPGGAPGFLVDLLRTVQRLRIWRWAEHTFGQPDVAPGTLMERMVGQPEVDPRSPLVDRAVSDYRDNLRRVIELCRRDNVPVVFCEPVSNLSGHYPFGSLLPEPRATAMSRRRDLWELELRRREGEVSPAAVMDRWRTMIQGDSISADLWFHGGVNAAAAGETASAQRAFRKARDWDTVPFRASSRFLDALRGLCAAEGVPLVPLETILDQAATGPAPGDDLFVEHLHPGLRGQCMVAEAICDVMEKMPWPAPDAEWNHPAPASCRLTLQMAGLTGIDALFAELRVAQLLRRWPYAQPAGRARDATRSFLEEDPLRTYRRPTVYAEAARLWEQSGDAWLGDEIAGFEDTLSWGARPDSIELLWARKALMEELTLLDAHRQAARAYAAAGDYARSFIEYRAAARLFPVDPDNFIRAGQALLALEKVERARNYFVQADVLGPGRPELMTLIADCELKLGRPAAARSWIDRVLAVQPGHPQARQILARLQEEAAAEEPW